MNGSKLLCVAAALCFLCGALAGSVHTAQPKVVAGGDSTPWFELQLDDSYLLMWQITGMNSSEPMISVSLQLRGLAWVGFGLSPSGSMIDGLFFVFLLDI